MSKSGITLILDLILLARLMHTLYPISVKLYLFYDQSGWGDHVSLYWLFWMLFVKVKGQGQLQ